ncbi:MAG: hypothetical protein KF901_33780 [Myxococcales bacterium]|nr:hypothetical protein [Myxococcales bacterium]
MAWRGQGRNVRRGLGVVLAQGLALVATNGSSVSCYDDCGDGYMPDRILAGSLRIVDAGAPDGADGSGAAPDGGVFMNVFVDASLEEMLAMPCEEVCRRIDSRPVESCSGPERAPEEVYFSQALDAQVASTVYSVRCVPVVTCTSGCIPWGE